MHHMTVWNIMEHHMTERLSLFGAGVILGSEIGLGQQDQAHSVKAPGWSPSGLQ